MADTLSQDVRRLLPVRESCLSRRQQLWVLAIAAPLVVGPAWCAWLGGLPAQLGTLNGLVLIALLCASSVTDLRQRKIYNWTTYPAWGWALVLNSVSGSSASLGAVGLRDSLAGAALCFGCVFCAYLASRGGAGDVKLAASMGALLGWEQGILAVAFGYVVAAAAITTERIAVEGMGRCLRTVIRQLVTIVFPAGVLLPPREKPMIWQGSIPLAPFFSSGAILALLWKYL